MSKHIAIFGATGGIGVAITQRFADESFQLSICSRNEKELERLEGKLKCKVFSKACDVLEENDVRSFLNDSVKLTLWYWALVLNQQIENLTLQMKMVGGDY